MLPAFVASSSFRKFFLIPGFESSDCNQIIFPHPIQMMRGRFLTYDLIKSSVACVAQAKIGSVKRLRHFWSGNPDS